MLASRPAELECPVQHQQKVVNLIVGKKEADSHAPAGVLQLAVEAVSCWRPVTCHPNEVIYSMLGKGIKLWNRIH